VVHRIAASQSWAPLHLPEVFAYRDLLYSLVGREIRVRYKQTVLGAAWALIQPLSTMVVFSVFFGRFAGMPSDGIPYPLFSLSALIAWQLFAFALTESSNSLVTHQRIISKVYFPRLILPMASVCVGLVDFALALTVLAAMMLFYGVAPGVAVVTVPFWALLAVMTALSVGLWLSALNVRYRDVRYTIPFFTQLWMFATPVAYPLSIVPETWRPLVALNPMVGVVQGFRWALVGGEPPALSVAMSVVIVSVTLVGGLFFFRRVERTFADVI
jgi:lipopolysaccharide transport system permease protein